jgi:hypothetical protein
LELDFWIFSFVDLKDAWMIRVDDSQDHHLIKMRFQLPKRIESNFTSVATRVFEKEGSSKILGVSSFFIRIVKPGEPFLVPGMIQIVKIQFAIVLTIQGLFPNFD